MFLPNIIWIFLQLGKLSQNKKGQLIFETQCMQLFTLHSWLSNVYADRDFRPFWFSWPWPWLSDLHIRTWPIFLEIYPMCKNEFPTSRLSKVIALQTCRQTDRQTDTTEIIYQAPSPSRVVKRLNASSLTKSLSNSTDFIRVKIALTPV